MAVDGKRSYRRTAPKKSADPTYQIERQRAWKLRKKWPYPGSPGDVAGAVDALDTMLTTQVEAIWDKFALGDGELSGAQLEMAMSLRRELIKKKATSNDSNESENIGRLLTKMADREK
jgi:hypothetical protein